MNLIKEEKMIKQFIKLTYQNRILFEFKNPQKRLSGYMRFSHNTKKILNNDKIFSIRKMISKSDFFDFFSKTDSLYIISVSYIDGIILRLEEAYDLISNEYMPVIIIGEDKVLIKEETEKRDVHFFLLA